MTTPMLEKCARALEEAEVGYSIRLVRLVDEVSTYNARVDDGPVREFPSHGEALEYVQEFARAAKVRAVLTALLEPDGGMVEAMKRSYRATEEYGLDDEDLAKGFTAAIQQALKGEGNV